MTRSELIEKLAEAKNINPVVAEQAVLTMIEAMKDTLVAGDRIEIRGFGSFEIREYSGRTSARNPKSGAPIVVAPRKAPFFKAGKEMRDKLLSTGG